MIQIGSIFQFSLAFLSVYLRLQV